MAECIPHDYLNLIRRKRQEDPPEVESVETDIVTSVARAKGTKIRKRTKGNQVLDEESEDESHPQPADKCIPRQDDTKAAVHEGLVTDNDVLNKEIKKSQKGRRIHKILFWRKKDSHKSKKSASSAESDNRVSSKHESDPTAADPQPEVSTAHSKAKSATAKQIHRPQVDRIRTHHGHQRIASVETWKRLQNIEDENLPWWHRSRVFHKYKKTKATCPQDKQAKTSEPEENMATQADAELHENDELDDVLNPTVDYEHTCAICYDVFVKPHKIRPCGHVFCELCLRQLQHCTASRLATGVPLARRPVVAKRDVLVLCPVCRGPIQKCEANEDLNEIMHSKYPRRYQERQKQMQEETRKLKESKLPSCTVIPLQRPKLARFQDQPVHQHLRFLRFLKTFFGVILHCLWIIAMCIGSVILAAYLTCMVITVGHFKFCFAFVDKNKVLFEPETGRHRSILSFNMMRVFSAVFFFIAFELFFTLHWGQLFCLTFLSLFITLMGYTLAGHPEKTIFRVMVKAVTYPSRGYRR